MRFVNFQIENFKSIIDSGLCYFSDVDNILVLAGQNEAGKSAVLEALDYFRNGPSENFDRLQRRQHESPRVSCKFRLEDDEIEDIFGKTKNDSLRSYLKKNPEITFCRSEEYDQSEDIYFGQSDDDSIKPLFPQEEEEEIQESSEDTTPIVPDNEEPDVPTTTASDSNETNSTLPDTKSDPPEINGFRELEEYVCGNVQEFIIYEGFSDLLPGLVKLSEIDKFPAILDFEKVYGISFSKIVTQDPRSIKREELRLNRAAGDDLNTYWSQKLEQGGQYNFHVDFTKRDPIEESEILFSIDRNDGDPLYMEQKSKGFRWFSAFNLRLRAHGIDKDNVKNLVILLDEPGQGLHETAQSDVLNVISELAEKGAQIIYATHHPNLIGVEGEEIARIRLVSNSVGIGTKVQTISQFSAGENHGSIDALSPIISAMGIHAGRNFVSENKLNVVVEGISDHFYFTAFKRILNKDERLYFLPSIGAPNIPPLVSVLLGWGLNYLAVFDDDQGSGRKAYTLLKKKFFENDNDLAHERILKIHGCNGIEDIFSSEDFYKYVLGEEYPSGGSSQKNSQLVGDNKVLRARLFLETVNQGEITLSSETLEKIEEVFSWIYEKFKIEN